MAIIRAIGYHAPKLNRRLIPSEYLRHISGPPLSLDALSSAFNSTVWTKRVVLPAFGEVVPHEMHKIVDLADQIACSFGADYIAVPLSMTYDERFSQVVADAIRGTKRVFISIKVAELGSSLSASNNSILVDMLYKIAKFAGPEGCTRFALSYGDQPETTYFPDAASRREGFSIALRYASDLVDHITPELDTVNIANEILKIALPFDSKAKKISDEYGFSYIGLDSSISPWMEESVAEIVSKMIDDEFGGLGTYHAIHKLNSALEKIKEHVRCTGFNEIMLPVAEDNLLKRLGGEGKIRLQHLVSMISVCVAGLDMVPISLSASKRNVVKLLSDVFSIACRRNKSIGVRLLLTPSEPNTWVNVGKFGRSPVFEV